MTIYAINPKKKDLESYERIVKVSILVLMEAALKPKGRNSF